MSTKAPNLHVSEWVQGLPTNIDKNIGKVVLIEVFQVNCPGCFMYALPNAIEIYKNNSRYCGVFKNSRINLRRNMSDLSLGSVGSL